MIKKNMPIQCIGDVCSVNPPLCTEIGASLPLIAFYMNLMKVEAAAVIDKKNHCIGFVTGDDVTDFVFDVNAKNEPCVGDIMRFPNMSVYLDDPLEQALRMMTQYKIDWLPVIDFDRQTFSGLVCRKDIKGVASNITSFSKKKLARK